jgi:hypothetical protein
MLHCSQWQLSVLVRSKWTLFLPFPLFSSFPAPSSLVAKLLQRSVVQSFSSKIESCQERAASCPSVKGLFLFIIY